MTDEGVRGLAAARPKLQELALDDDRRVSAAGISSLAECCPSLQASLNAHNETTVEHGSSIGKNFMEDAYQSTSASIPGGQDQDYSRFHSLEQLLLSSVHRRHSAVGSTRLSRSSAYGS